VSNCDCYLNFIWNANGNYCYRDCSKYSNTKGLDKRDKNYSICECENNELIWNNGPDNIGCERECIRNLTNNIVGVNQDIRT
jgi:hypothetical protein